MPLNDLLKVAGSVPLFLGSTFMFFSGNSWINNIGFSLALVGMAMIFVGIVRK